MAHGANASSKPASWVAVGVIVAGFVVGGLGLVLGPTWWLFWVGVVLAVIGGIIALATGIFEDVEMDPVHGPQSLHEHRRGYGGARDTTRDSGRPTG